MDLNRVTLKQRAMRKIPLFQALSTEEHDELCALLELREYKREESIIISDRTGYDVMFVADGSVYVKKSHASGKEVIVSRLATGELFGEIALLTEAKRSADVVAAEDCMVLLMRQEDFEKLVSECVAFNRALMTSLAQRVADASSRIADLALLDVSSRVWKILQSLIETRSDGTRAVPFPPTHKEFAAMVGTSREMVTRALSKMEDNGVLRMKGKEIILLDE